MALRFGIILLLSLALAACGRRGPLEPPPDPSAVQKQQQKQEKTKTGKVEAAKTKPKAATPEDGGTSPEEDKTTMRSEPGSDDEAEDGDKTSFLPSPTPNSKKRPRGYTIPKDPFILDPLL